VPVYRLVEAIIIIYLEGIAHPKLATQCPLLYISWRIFSDRSPLIK